MHPPTPPPPAGPPARSIWDDGTANPEPALDQFTLVSKYQALGQLLAGLSVFGAVGTVAYLYAPEKRVPWVRALCVRVRGEQEQHEGQQASCAEGLGCVGGGRARCWWGWLLTCAALCCVALQVPKEVVVPPEVANYNK